LINDCPRVPGHHEVSCEGSWVHIRSLGVCISILKALFTIIKTTQKCFILKLWVVAVNSIQNTISLLLSTYKGLLSMLAEWGLRLISWAAARVSGRGTTIARKTNDLHVYNSCVYDKVK
jgi:hypothetical protein